MFQLLKNPNFDFLGKRNILLTVSAILVALSIGAMAVKGLNPGIEFSGGTELQIKYADAPDVAAIRSALSAASLPNHAVTTIGNEDENEIYIRVGTAKDKAADQKITQTVVTALLGSHVTGMNADMNIVDASRVEEMLESVPSLTVEGRKILAASMLEYRREVAIFAAVDDLSGVPGMTPDVMAELKRSAGIGPLAVRSQSYIGPSIGRELMNKAILAIVGSLIGMLIYIWIRFQLQWGFAAVVALAHDTIITLGLFSLFGKEMSLPVVAAFLTLVGYSVNDTVVVFDRIRENLKSKRSQSLEAVINTSINQTLSRTIITSGLTWIVTMGLFLFGGPALNSFAFVLTIGVMVGTYSSIYVASPFLIIWKRFVDGRRSAASRASTKKIQTA